MYYKLAYKFIDICFVKKTRRTMYNMHKIKYKKLYKKKKYIK